MSAPAAQDHALNIRVMRLAKPSFASCFPINASGNDIFTDRSCPSLLNGCGLGMSLIVPQTFGMVHVGEDFSCLVSVFNESQNRIASDIQLKADLQTQSQRSPLQEVVPVTENTLVVGGRFDTVIKSRLTDTGAHILVCSISYAVESEKLNFRKFFRFDVRRLADVRVRCFPTPTKSWFLEATLVNTASQILWLESIGLNVAGAAVGTLVHKPAHLSKLLRPQESLVLIFSVDRDLAEMNRPRTTGQLPQAIPGQIALKFRSSFGDVASSSFLAQIPPDVCSQAKLLVKVDSSTDVDVGCGIPVKLNLTNVTNSNLSLGLELGTGSDFLGVGETAYHMNELLPGQPTSVSFHVLPLKPGFVNFPQMSILIRNQHQYIRDIPTPMLTMFASVQSSSVSAST